MFNAIGEAIIKLRNSLKGRGISILTTSHNGSKIVEAIGFNADRGFWRHLRKALAKAGLNDGYGAVIILQLIAGLFMKQTLRATYRAKASCNEGDVFSFEKGQKLAKARVREKMLRQQCNYLYSLRAKLIQLFDVVDDRFYEIGDMYDHAAEDLDATLAELHEPQGE